MFMRDDRILQNFCWIPETKWRFTSQGKSIDKSILYYSNKTFSGVLRGAGGGHV